MRLFIAINLNDEVKEALMDIQDTMRTYGVHGRETPEENMHLTLAFIGDYDDPDYVKSIVDSIEIRPFDITLKGIGAFGDLWWAGIDESAPLQSVARRLRRALSEADIPFDRKKFDPHITFLRKAQIRRENPFQFSDVKVRQAEMFVHSISLMRSDFGKRGAVYTEVGSITGHKENDSGVIP